MPRYYKKITRLMDYKEFCQTAHLSGSPLKRAFLEILFWSGRRVSEVLLLTNRDMDIVKTSIFLNLWHLKKHKYKRGDKKGQSKNYKRVQQIPYTPFLIPITSIEGLIFPHGRKWGYRVVKAVFPDLYPHYFRLNRGTQTGIEHGDAQGRALLDISMSAYEAYRGDIDLRKVYETLNQEAFNL